MKKLVSPVTMFLFGVIAFIKASISVSIPEILKADYTSKGDEVETFNDVDNNPAQMSLIEKETTVSTTVAIAVFVLVYLFNPLA